MDPVFALSISGPLTDIGAVAGLVAIPGLAILSLLYLAQAREVKRLREWAGRAPERAAELHEQLFNPDERAKPTAAEKIQLAEREPPDPDWVESVFDQVNVLVLEDNADALAARVVELAGARAPTGVRAAP